jgi:hypothetical protein
LRFSATVPTAPWLAACQSWPMAYVLYGLLALDPASARLAGRGAIELAPGTMVRPVDVRGMSVEPGFHRLDADAETSARRISADGRVVYVEAEFFGGTGTQASIGWEAGQRSFGPVKTQIGEDEPGFETVDEVAEMAINQALRWLGVRRTARLDEFDVLGLRRLRGVGG